MSQKEIGWFWNLENFYNSELIELEKNTVNIHLYNFFFFHVPFVFGLPHRALVSCPQVRFKGTPFVPSTEHSVPVVK